MRRPPKLIWFPHALTEDGLIPHEWLFFVLLIAMLLCVGCMWLYVRRRRGVLVSKSTVVLLAAIALLILTETWLHLSIHSPYTYIPHFERPTSEAYWYHVALFQNGQGLVNADYFVFHALEQVFLGTPEQFNGMLIRRPFPYYLSAQLGYFINPYYIFLSFNITIWMMTALACYDYLAAHFGKAQASIAALFVASGPGFIMYVAQPQTYLWGYCAIILVIWAHWKLCGDPHAGVREYLLLGIVVSLALLTYDLLSLLFYFAGYEILLKRKIKLIFLTFGVAIGIYIAFGLLTAPMTSFTHDDRNSKFIGISVANLVHLLKSSPINFENYVVYTKLLPGFVWSLSNSLFVFPVFVAAAGAFCLNSTSKLKLIGLLFLPSLASVTFLHLGRLDIASFPRFAFIAYPAVYALVGCAIWSLVRLVGSWWGRSALAIAVCAIAAQVALSNADAFGHPWLYYLFYYQAPSLAHF